MSHARTFTRRFVSAALVAISFVATSSSTSLAPVARAIAGVWWVAASGTAANPPSDGSSCANPGFVGATDASIQAAIDAASAGEEVRICSGTYNIGTTVNVNKAITVTGSGDTLPIFDGGKAHRIMTVGSGAVETITISYLHFRNAYVFNGHGASIRQDGNATLHVSNSLFADNVVIDAHGAGIALVADANQNLPGSFHITSSTFVNNKAFDGAGAIVVGLQRNTSTIENSTFVRNVASRGGGGANGSFASLSIANSTFIDNSAGDHGDAFWSASSKGLLVANTGAVSTSSQLCELNGNTPVDNVSTDASCIDTSGGDSVVTLADLKIGQFGPWGVGAYAYSINSGSAAIGAVDATHCSTSDARGVSRSGTSCDAGSFEFITGAPSITPSSSMSLVKGKAINPAVTFTSSGLTAPVTFRVASEISAALPDGVTFSASTGQIAGTPTENVFTKSLVVTATDSLGKIANAMVEVDNCTLTSSGGKYQIANADDLAIFGFAACGLNADYVQTADIEWNAEWESAATLASPFTGSYDGGSHSISGLDIIGSPAAFLVGLDNATIENLTLQGTVTGTGVSAFFTSWGVSSTLRNVHARGTVAGPNGGQAGGCSGGIIGEASDTTLTGSSFEGTVDTPDASWIGGLAGCVYSNTIIGTSYVDGTVKGVENVGGLVGWLEDSDIHDSYVVGAIEATGPKNGGLVGWQGASIEGSEGDSNDADNIAIKNSFANVTVTSTNPMGGLVGWGRSTAIANSYWNIEKTGASDLTPIVEMSDVGGTQPTSTTATAANIASKDFFADAGWAIVSGWFDPTTTSNVWGMCNGIDRPVLLWEKTASTCAVPGSTQTTPDPTPEPTPEPVVPTPTTTVAPTPSTVAPTNTVAPSNITASTTTTVPRSTTTTTIPAPAVYQGGVVAMVGSKQVKSTVQWNGNSQIEGTIGSVKMKLQFAPGATNTSNRGSLAVGGKFTVVLKGLKSGSSATTGLSGKAMRLSKSTTTAKGAVKLKVTIPKTAKVGAQKLRITVVDKNGQPVSLWFGVVIRK